MGELSFSVNGSRWESDRPPFPLLQPEKVLALPLQLRFDEGYTYPSEASSRSVALIATSFSSIPPAETARCTVHVWIDQRTFARVKVQAVQAVTRSRRVQPRKPLRTST